MEKLLAKIKINKPRMKSVLVRAVATNISGLSTPCFRPSMKKHYYEFLKLSGLTEKDVRDYAKRVWVGRKEAVFQLHKEPLANFYIFLMHYFLNKNDKLMAQYFMIFYELRHYAARFEIHFKYCQEDVFKYTLDTLTKTHLFSREKTIGNAIYFLSKELMKQWGPAIKNYDLDKISKFITYARHRIAQSTRSFAETYYKNAELGLGIQTQREPADDEENSYQHVTTDKFRKY